MDQRLLVATLVLGLAAAAYPSLGSAPAGPQVRAFTFEVTAFSCPFDDGVCLAYNAVVPGPLIDANLGDTLVITLVNRIAATLPEGAPGHLATVDVSWHVHGTAVPANMDGVSAHEGTQLIESVAKPGGSFTYTTRAAFAGTWHYHDHVIGLDGDEGGHRGLYGSLVVRNGAEPVPDTVLDLHMLDDGANGGRGLNAAVAAGSSFDLVVVGLENILWQVTLTDPSNAIVGTVEAAPGISERIHVDNAVAGTYSWRATGFGTKTGQVVVS